MSLFGEVLELLYPSRCCFCHRLIEEGALCRTCLEKLPYARGAACEQRVPNLARCVSPLFYEGDVRASLLRYKFGGRRGYASVYGKIMGKCLDENAISCDSITWVPVSRRRLRKRGYDQARLLAEAIAGDRGLRAEPLLRKTRHNRPQSRTPGIRQRRENVQGVYTAVDPERIRDRRILLVDDIVTTGATLSECARILRQAGARSVTAVTVARRRD